MPQVITRTTRWLLPAGGALFNEGDLQNRHERIRDYALALTVVPSFSFLFFSFFLSRQPDRNGGRSWPMKFVFFRLINHWI